MDNRKVFTHMPLKKNEEFTFYGEPVRTGKPFEEGEIIDLYVERDRNDLGDEIIYGQARVLGVHLTQKGCYKAIVL